jgi:hypothetical protein
MRKASVYCEVCEIPFDVDLDAMVPPLTGEDWYERLAETVEAATCPLCGEMALTVQACLDCTDWWAHLGVTDTVLLPLGAPLDTPLDDWLVGVEALLEELRRQGEEP